MKKLMSFKSFTLNEAAVVDTFLEKIKNAKTEAGLKELKKYYEKRKKEVEVSDSDDITVRDAIEGRFVELEQEAKDAMGDEPEEQV